MSEEVSVGGRRQLRGRVVSDKMDKTIVVAVERQFKHPRYRKYVTRVNRYAAHDPTNKFKIDDVVTIEESRPLSRTKRWVVVDESEAS